MWREGWYCSCVPTTCEHYTDSRSPGVLAPTVHQLTFLPLFCVAKLRCWILKAIQTFQSKHITSETLWIRYLITRISTMCDFDPACYRENMFGWRCLVRPYTASSHMSHRNVEVRLFRSEAPYWGIWQRRQFPVADVHQLTYQRANLNSTYYVAQKVETQHLFSSGAVAEAYWLPTYTLLRLDKEQDIQTWSLHMANPSLNAMVQSSSRSNFPCQPPISTAL